MALKAFDPLDAAISLAPHSPLLLHALPTRTSSSFIRAPCSFVPWALAMPSSLPGPQSISLAQLHVDRTSHPLWISLGMISFGESPLIPTVLDEIQLLFAPMAP